jgi:hypothetical protein
MMKSTASHIASFAALAVSLMLHNSAGMTAEAVGASLGSTAAPSATVDANKSYETAFDGTENPISEGGVWTHKGADWSKVATANGIAVGTQTGSPGQLRANLYDDSYAVLSGFPADHSVSVVLHRGSSIDSSCSHEYEILLRWSDDTHSARGYELNLNFDGSYAQIMRWNGNYGDFTELGGGSFHSVKDGDTFEATIVGDLITTYVNGTKIAQVRDSTFASGNPGIGFFRGSCGSNTDIGFKSFKATSGSGGSTVRPMPPGSVSAS